ncbi:MAG: hypothetical protein KBF98_08880, partial [Rhodoferax sp.]|nr:hypothetical protein [Rhodoferax sp.]
CRLPSICLEGSTVAPPPGPARIRPLTGQHSCRQPAKVIVVKQHSGFAHDRGGNQYQIIINGIGSNLHALWDFALVSHVSPDLDVWMQKLSRLPELPASMSMNPAQMANESCEIVAAVGFYPEHIVTAQYLDQNAPVVVSRLQRAATRLARLFNRVWP